ncbi:MAG: hypothetical protein N3A54_04855 [Patescibacteria group bacterium]|nr:hypothetical protein [Patescibacteria group bacterium]
MKYTEFKDLLLEYNIKDLSAIFGEYFDRIGLQYADERWISSSFSKIYNAFEKKINKVRELYLLDKTELKIPLSLITNTYSKLKKAFELETQLSDKILDSYVGSFILYFPALLLVVAYFRKFPDRLSKLLDEKELAKYVELIKTYESLSFGDILHSLPLTTFDSDMKKIFENYIFPTYVEKSIKTIYSDDEVVIYKPQRWAECRHLAPDTNWCISSSSAKENFTLYYNQRNFDIYFIFEKNKGTRGKMAFLIKRDLDLDKEIKELDRLKDVTEKQGKNLDTIFKMMKATFVGSLLVKTSWLNIGDWKGFVSKMLNNNEIVKTLKLLNKKVSNERALIDLYRKNFEKLNLKKKKAESYSIVKMLVSSPVNLLFDILYTIGVLAEDVYFITEKYMSGYDDKKERVVARIMAIYNLDDGKTLLKLMNDYDYLYSIFSDFNSLIWRNYNPFAEFDHNAEEVFLRMFFYQNNTLNLSDIVVNRHYVEIKNHANKDIPFSRLSDYLLRLDNSEQAYKYAHLIKMWEKWEESLKKMNRTEEIKKTTFDDIDDVKRSYERGKLALGGDPNWFVLSSSDIFSNDKLIPLAKEMLSKSKSLLELYMNVVEHVWGNVILGSVREIAINLKESDLKDDALNWVYSGSASHHIMKHPLFVKMYEVMEQELIKE